MIRQLVSLSVKLPLAAAGFAAEVVKELIGVRPEPAVAPPPPRTEREPEPAADLEPEPAPDLEPEPAPDLEPEGPVGAEVHVDEPWEGYDEMRAEEIVRRLRAADGARLAIVRLYEANHRGRKTVLRAADSAVAGRAGTNGA